MKMLETLQAKARDAEAAVARAEAEQKQRAAEQKKRAERASQRAKREPGWATSSAFTACWPAIEFPR
jgi:hypothetical protein